MKSLLPFRTAIGTLAIGVCSVANAATIMNGNFDEDVIANGTFTQTKTLSGGWINAQVDPNATIELRNNVAGAAQSPNNYVELDSKFNSEMQQTIFNTILGQEYLLTFWYSPRQGIEAISNGINVFWNNMLVNTDGVITGKGLPIPQGNLWVEKAFTVFGTGGNVDLKLAAAGTSDSFGGGVDTMKLSAVPLPGAALLFGTAFLTGAVARRKKQKQIAAEKSMVA